MKRYFVFMALLLGINLALSNITLGMSGAVLDIIAFFSFRPKHFLVYLIAGLPQSLINIMLYSGFWASAIVSIKYGLESGIGTLFSSQLGSLALILGFNIFWSIYAVFTYGRINKIKDTTHHLNIYSKLYQVPSRFAQRRINWNNRLVKVVKIGTISSVIVFTLVMMPIYYLIMTNWLGFHMGFACPYLHWNYGVID